MVKTFFLINNSESFIFSEKYRINIFLKRLLSARKSPKIHNPLRLCGKQTILKLEMKYELFTTTLQGS